VQEAGWVVGGLGEWTGATGADGGGAVERPAGKHAAVSLSGSTIYLLSSTHWVI